jgi:hypothetical protein
MELLESDSARPRQARYQAALRPDINCTIDSRALSNFIATPILHFWPNRAKTMPNTFTESRLCQNQTHLIGLAFFFPEAYRFI